MSAPLSGSSGGSPAPGFYPDPSIPGYIRYWNGSSWVPGTSRPEPQEGEAMPTPPSAAAASSAIAPPTSGEPAPAEETGPVFLDEETSGAGPEAQVPAARSGESPLPEVRPRGEVAPSAEVIDWDDPSRLHGQRPASASAWQADVSRQSGFAGQGEERVSWGRAEGGDESAGGAAGAAGAAGADPRGGWGRPADEGPFEGCTDSGAGAAADSAAAADSSASAPADASPAAPASPESAGSPPREGTVQMRAMSPEALRRAAQEARSAGGAPGAQPAQPGSPQPEHTVGLRRSDVLNPAADSRSPSAPRAPQAPGAPSVPGQGAPAQPQAPAHSQSAHSRSAQPQPQSPAQASAPQPPPAVPQQGAPPQGAAPGPGSAAQPSWAQQVHDLAGGGAQAGVPAGGPGAHGAPGPEVVMPWRPPAADPFLRAAQQEARPAGLGKRFAARVVDGVLTGAVAVAVASPFTGPAVDHVQGKIDAVRAAGETKTVWLIDGTTGGYLAVVLGALLLFGLLYEVLPTSRWGRTLGKKLFGLRVLTMEQQEKPGFRGALLRWLTYGVLSALVIGVVNVLWCVFDRPWRQCWHDKVAGTFVSKDSGEIRL